MHHTFLTKHRDLLASIADSIGYTLEVRGEEGDSFLWVGLNAPDKSTPSLSVDYSERSGKLRFSTMLPVDRWGYPQKGYQMGYSNKLATNDTNVSATNSTERIAGYVRKLIREQHDAHMAHLEAIERAEAYYDRQMDTLDRLAFMLPHLKPQVHGLNERPNHNGVVKTSITFPDRHDISVEVTGSGVNINATSIGARIAAKMLHEAIANNTKKP